MPVEEVEALVAEIAARVVVDDVQDHREAVDVAEVDQRLELVHLAAQVLDLRSGARPLASSSAFTCVDVGREVRVLHREVHLRREIIGPVVAEAELGLELLDRQELDRGDAEPGEVRDLARHVEERARPSPAGSA